MEFLICLAALGVALIFAGIAGLFILVIVGAFIKGVAETVASMFKGGAGLCRDAATFGRWLAGKAAR